MSGLRGWTTVNVPELSVLCVGRDPRTRGYDGDPLSIIHDGMAGFDPTSFDLGERAMIRALCADVIARIDELEVSR